MIVGGIITLGWTPGENNQGRSGNYIVRAYNVVMARKQDGGCIRMITSAIIIEASFSRN